MDEAGDLEVVAASCQEVLEPAFRVRLALLQPDLLAHGVALDLLPLFAVGQSRQFRGAGPLAKARILAGARRRLIADLRALGERAPVALVQRHVDMTPSLALEKAVVAKRRLVYDTDDAIWLTGRQTGGHPLGVLKGVARKVRWLAERAAHVIAGNDVLAEHLATYNDAVTVVPSLVDYRAYAQRRHLQAEQVTLGWIGSHTTAPYLQAIVPALERFAKQSRRGVRLLMVGGSAPRIAGVRVDEHAWSPAVEREALAEIDIGLMPLADTPWTRGKCAYKALQYMAAGIPPVVDDVGISARAVSGAGYVATGSDQWLEALDTLAGDSGLRDRLGEAGRRRIAEDFSPQRWLPTVAAILRG